MAKIDASCVRCYTKTIGNRTFHTEQSSDGQWALYEVKLNRVGEEVREYWNHFALKRGAWNAAEEQIKEEGIARKLSVATCSAV